MEIYDVSRYTKDDAFDLLIGEKIGSGYARDVYLCPLDSSVVVKIEDKSRTYQNPVEWETWTFVAGTEYAKWFAPCLRISMNARVLIMKRTAPIAKLPRLLPSFMVDLKPENWGMLDDRVVCHDYGTISVNLCRTLENFRMKKVRAK